MRKKYRKIEECIWRLLRNMSFENPLDGVEEHREERTDQTQAAGRQDAARAEDAVVGGGRRLACGDRLGWAAVGRGLGWVAACRRGLQGGRVSDAEGSRPGTPIFQSKHHGQILPC